MLPVILVIEGSEIQARMIGDRVQKDLGLEVWSAKNLEGLEDLLHRAQGRPLIAVSNLILPDCEPGQAVDMCLAEGIPTVVLTSSFEPQVRKELLKKQVADYVIKTSSSLSELTAILKRLVHNAQFEVLIVDDSRLFRQEQARLLKLFRFVVFEASNGVEALAQLQAHPEVRLVLTDLEMPQLNGLQLTNEIRKTYPKDKLAIIGLSAYADDETSAMFIKNGANDFLRKPFLQEEFNCRVQQNVEMLEYIQELYLAAYQDFLTNLPNRKHFFEAGGQKLANRKAQCLAMFDLDHFKQINDQWGHEAGDAVLCHFAALLKEQLGERGLIARLGGEEFAVMLDESLESARPLLEGLRQKTAESALLWKGQELKLTVSVGLTLIDGQSLDAGLSAADKNLYLAKERGRNQLVG
ncbi:MAG: diguanylate cyclase [bacterium]|nr:diguanylate cyclase [bacterium]